MAALASPTFVIPSACILGEGPVWDDRLTCLWWTDIQNRRLLRWDWKAQTYGQFALPERLGSLGLTTDPAWLICAFASGFALYNPETEALRWIDHAEAHYRGIRFNDGRVDPAGRFWAGSMVEDRELAAGASGTLYRLDCLAAATPLFTGIGISNSICFANDGRRMFFADTPTRKIRSYQIGADGRLEDEQQFAEVEGPGSPDGSECDAEGMLWNAEWGGSRITRYRRDGTIDQHFNVPVSQPTCVTFGGPELDHLFVTSARENLPSDQLVDEPLAGHTLVYKLPVRGLPAPRFPFDQPVMAQ